jgi:hypothetical protein
VTFGRAAAFGVRQGFLNHSAGRVTPDEAKQAFARVGLTHPRTQTSPPGVVFNYGKAPHTVSVNVYSGAPLKVLFLHTPKDMRVTQWANVMVYYNKSETRAVRQASKTLGDRTWSSSLPKSSIPIPGSSKTSSGS